MLMRMMTTTMGSSSRSIVIIVKICILFLLPLQLGMWVIHSREVLLGLHGIWWLLLCVPLCLSHTKDSLGCVVPDLGRFSAPSSTITLLNCPEGVAIKAELDKPKVQRWAQNKLCDNSGLGTPVFTLGVARTHDKATNNGRGWGEEWDLSALANLMCCPLMWHREWRFSAYLNSKPHQ